MRHANARAVQFHKSRKSALGFIDQTLRTLHTMRQNRSSLYTSVSLGPFVSLFIRECEHLRSQLEPLSPDEDAKSENMSLLMYRLHLINALLRCFGDQIATDIQFVNQ